MMATTATKARLRKPVTHKRTASMPQSPAFATIARSITKLEKRARRTWREFVPWWNAQADHRRLAFVVVAIVAVIGVVNLAGIGRSGPNQLVPAAPVVAARSARIVMPEAAPTDQGKAWVATQLWQGSGSRVTESFVVGAHWRVDWLYDPPQSGGVLQVFIYAADGHLLMDTAANTQKSGPDSSFWMGAGTYYLKVNSTGGDWKLDVQDLH
jgi:hypothetical protein